MQNFRLKCKTIFKLGTLIELFIFHEKDLKFSVKNQYNQIKSSAQIKNVKSTAMFIEKLFTNDYLLAFCIF